MPLPPPLLPARKEISPLKAKDLLREEREEADTEGGIPSAHPLRVGGCLSNKSVVESFGSRNLDLRPSSKVIASRSTLSSSFLSFSRVPDLTGQPCEVMGTREGGIDAGERDSGVCLESHSGLLQPSLPGGEILRGLETGNRPFSTQRVYTTNLFQRWRQSQLLSSIREGDFMASVDLLDVYCKVPIHKSRKFLRFTCQGTVYQFNAVCFGLTTAPQVFTRVYSLVSTWAHSWD